VSSTGLTVGWLVGGVALGILAANWVYEDGDPGDRGFVAACAFTVCVVAFPIIGGALVLAGLFIAGGWLLPARRRELREKRDLRRRNEIARSQQETDRLRAEVGLPPFNWDGSAQ
jgi:hypothetical protein